MGRFISKFVETKTKTFDWPNWHHVTTSCNLWKLGRDTFLCFLNIQWKPLFFHSAFTIGGSVCVLLYAPYRPSNSVYDFPRMGVHIRQTYLPRVGKYLPWNRHSGTRAHGLVTTTPTVQDFTPLNPPSDWTGPCMGGGGNGVNHCITPPKWVSTTLRLGGSICPRDDPRRWRKWITVLTNALVNVTHHYVSIEPLW
jgi:hypothetical protein